MEITTFDEFLDTTLSMVSMTEPDMDVAISVAATIGSLVQRGYKDLAMDVLLTYKPAPKCPRCQKRSPSVLLDNDGEPYMCDECWEDA